MVRRRLFNRWKRLERRGSKQRGDIEQRATVGSGIVQIGRSRRWAERRDRQVVDHLRTCQHATPLELLCEISLLVKTRRKAPFRFWIGPLMPSMTQTESPPTF